MNLEVKASRHEFGIKVGPDGSGPRELTEWRTRRAEIDPNQEQNGTRIADEEVPRPGWLVL